MAFVEDFRIALSALATNKLRSALTMLGIVIGVAAVIAVVSIIQGLERMITEQLQSVGTTFIQVTPDFGPRGQRCPAATSSSPGRTAGRSPGRWGASG